MDISVVIPVYGCPNAVYELYKRLTNTLISMDITYEIIFVDDHDNMGSWEEIKKVADFDKRVKGISFTRNNGQDRAITAGVRESKGDWVITMDCDLQDSPERIPQLYSKVKAERLDTVFVRRQSRKEDCITLFFAKLYHKIFSYLTELPFDYEIGTYLITSRRSADIYCRAKDRGRDFGMFLMWLGYKHDFLDLEHDYRFSGKSSYSFLKKCNYAIRMMTTFSNRVLYIPVIVGSMAVIGSIIYMIIIFVAYFGFQSNPEGWTTIVAAVFFFGGAILSTLGIMGIYIGNVFDVSKNRPLYVIQEKVNCDEEKINQQHGIFS